MSGNTILPQFAVSKIAPARSARIDLSHVGLEEICGGSQPDQPDQPDIYDGRGGGRFGEGGGQLDRRRARGVLNPCP